MPPQPTPPLDTRPDELLTLYLAKDWEALSRRLLELLRHFEGHSYSAVSDVHQEAIDVFVKHFLYLFTQPDYVIPAEHGSTFVNMNPLLSNVVAMSSMKTTDAWLAIIGRQPDNLIKLLTLYSARNTTHIDRQHLFAVNPTAVSAWYAVFLRAYQSALVDETAWGHLREHLRAMPPDWTVHPEQSDAFFNSTYIDPEQDAAVRARVQRVVQKAWPLEVRNRAHPRRLAVATAFWYPQHSACRIQYEFVRSLAPDYELVLIQFGEPRPEVETSLFTDVIRIDRDGTLEPYRVLQDNTFRMVYFPDIGMTPQSIVLSNTRLAPIQVTTYGHPVSTFGGEIDYFIGSETIEEADLLPTIYSERPVLLPGLCVVHNSPPFKAVPGPRPRAERCIVNCSWFSQKVNFDLLRTLKEILERSKVDVLFRFFPGGSASRLNHFLPFLRSLQRTLGTRHVQVVPQADYTSYMIMLQEGSLALDSFHFGGSNVVVDSIHVRRPILCLEGHRWYNRIGPAILRQLGMPELVATRRDEYVDKAVQLITDADYRLSLLERLHDLDLDDLLYSKREVPHFKAAIDYLMVNHERLQAEGRRDPILVRTILSPAAV